MPRKDLESYSAKVKYRKHPGYLMWKFHRYSGVLLGVFIVLHVFLMADKLTFLSFIKAPSHIAGVAAIFILHTINGIRIIMMELFHSAERDKFKKHLYVASAIMGVLLIAFILRGDYINIMLDEYVRPFMKGAE